MFWLRFLSNVITSLTGDTSNREDGRQGWNARANYFSPPYFGFQGQPQPILEVVRRLKVDIISCGVCVCFQVLYDRMHKAVRSLISDAEALPLPSPIHSHPVSSSDSLFLAQIRLAARMKGW